MIRILINFRNKTVLLFLALVALVSAYSSSASMPEHILESGSMGSLDGEEMEDLPDNNVRGPTGKPMSDPMSGPMDRHWGRQRPQREGYEGGRADAGRQSPRPHQTQSPLAVKLIKRIEMCVRNSDVGDADNCIESIFDVNKKLKGLNRQKAGASI